MSNREICDKSAVELAADIRSKRLSPVEITEAVLERIEQLNPRLNAICIETPQEARQSAREAEAAVMRGDDLGPLHGVPISIKDLIHQKGVRITFGSKLFADNVAKEDSPVVERLRRAGAVLIGRTNTPEFGWKGVTDNLLFGITRNPWHPDLTPGGSSGGAAAAVAAGMGPVGIGSDGGGSIRIPASFCRLVGHKCSYGRVPNYPVSGDGSLVHTGPLSRTVADTALVYDVLAGPDERDRDSLPATGVRYAEQIDAGISGLRIAYSADLGFGEVDPRVAEICAAGAEKFSEAGATVEAVEPGWRDPFKHWATIFYGSIAGTLGNALERSGDELEPGLRKSVEKGLTLTAAEYVKALMHRNAFWQTVHSFFESYDLLLTPAIAVPPFPVGKIVPDPLPGQDRWTTSYTPFTYPFNLTGQPACSVPCGLIPAADGSDGKLPVGIQIVGRRFDDVTVLRAARAWEQIQPWNAERPALLDQL